MTLQEKKLRIQELNSMILELKKQRDTSTVVTKLTIQKLQQEIGDLEL
jgi:hypothetical protein